MDEEPIDMLDPVHLKRAARGMHGRLLACLPNDVKIELAGNAIQFIFNGATVQVLADAYWRHRTIVSWCVSVSRISGDPTGWISHRLPETTNVDHALIQVGMAMQYAEERACST
jgi:hypothetical protein